MSRSKVHVTRYLEALLQVLEPAAENWKPSCQSHCGCSVVPQQPAASKRVLGKPCRLTHLLWEWALPLAGRPVKVALSQSFVHGRFVLHRSSYEDLDNSRGLTQVGQCTTNRRRTRQIKFSEGDIFARLLTLTSFDLANFDELCNTKSIRLSERTSSMQAQFSSVSEINHPKELLQDSSDGGRAGRVDQRARSNLTYFCGFLFWRPNVD